MEEDFPTSDLGRGSGEVDIMASGINGNNQEWEWGCSGTGSGVVVESFGSVMPVRSPTLTTPTGTSQIS